MTDDVKDAPKLDLEDDEGPCPECQAPSRTTHTPGCPYPAKVTKAWKDWFKSVGGEEWDKIEDIEGELRRRRGEKP